VEGGEQERERATFPRNGDDIPFGSSFPFWTREGARACCC
jgi:hypothetical protein